MSVGLSGWIGRDEHRPRALGARILGQHAKTARDFLIGLEHASQIAAEAILVELVGCVDVPQTAAVRADFIRQHDAHRLVVPKATEFDLEVDEPNADSKEQADEEVVDAQRELHHFVDFLRRWPSRTP